VICFDLGGVMIRICRSWAEGCAAAGVPLRPGAAEIGAHGDLHDAHQLGQIDGALWARQLSARLGGLYAPREIMAVHEAWMLGEYPGLGPVIDVVHRLGLETAALSNTNAEHWRQMAAYPAVQRLRHRLASHELGLRKPDPAIYQALERRLHVTGPDIVFFDDLAENLAAARSRGWRAVEIDPQGDTAVQIVAALRRYGVEAGMSSC
jgi:putative hydrolase of the HAD superfamily